MNVIPAACRHETEPGHRAPGIDRERFVAEMVDWLNRRLVPPGRRVDATTPLFADGLIDSIRILKLIAWTERAIGRPIPDVRIRMDNFHSVDRIAEVFVEGGEPCGTQTPSCVNCAAAASCGARRRA